MRMLQPDPAVYERHSPAWRRLPTREWLPGHRRRETASERCPMLLPMEPRQRLCLLQTLNPETTSNHAGQRTLPPSAHNPPDLWISRRRNAGFSCPTSSQPGTTPDPPTPRRGPKETRWLQGLASRRPPARRPQEESNSPVPANRPGPPA